MRLEPSSLIDATNDGDRDLSNYKVVDATPMDAFDAHLETPEGPPSFTRTLWYAVRETRRTAWVLRSKATPGTEVWMRWLDEAVNAARNGDRQWPAVAYMNRLMAESL